MPPSDTPEVIALVRAELELVDVIAKQISREIGSVVEYDDLVSTGREGLLDAARRFDPTLGTAFRTYARIRVRGAIVDAVRQMAGLPRRAYERLSALRAAGLTSEGRLEPIPVGLQPYDEAGTEGLLTDQYEGFVIAAALGAETAHDPQPATDSSEVTGEPSGSGYRAADPEQALMRAELRALVRDVIGRLPQDEKVVVEKVYFEEQTLLAAARQLDYGKSWATRLHARAVIRLGQRLKPHL